MGGKPLELGIFLKNTLSMPTKNYAVIIGDSPSKGARSPILWNAVYEALGSDRRMVPLDVDEVYLPNVLKLLSSDESFIGGAITAPFKESVLTVDLGYQLSSLNNRLVSANCIFRSSQNRRIGACNTDVEAAVDCLLQKSESLTGKSVAILGFGGVGKPLAFKLNDMGVKCAVYKRNSSDSSNLGYSFPIFDWETITDTLTDFDIVINATNIGFSSDGSASDQSPIEQTLIEKLSKDTIIYDVIYSRAQTKFLNYANAAGLMFLDGSCMNLKQAILAFLKCNADLSCSPNFIHSTMEAVKNDHGW
jgi:shikimate dehydrogenase